MKMNLTDDVNTDVGNTVDYVIRMFLMSCENYIIDD